MRHLSDNKTELLPGFLPLVPNMPVLLTDNIACELGLSNGTQGIFRELVYDDKEDPVTFNMNNAIFPSNSIYVRKPLYALVEVNSSQVETNLDGLQPKLIPISLVKKEFSISIKQLLGPLLEQRTGRKAPDMIHVTRTQLPIVPAFVITTYKAQGFTMGKIVVDLQLAPTASQVASTYVPLSRVKRAEDLAILRPFDMKVLPRSSLVRRNRSVPLNSDDFLETGFRSRFRRTSSDQFPWVSSISNKFLVEILRNLPELFRWKLDRNRVVRKLSELNGADRKQTGSIRFVAGKQRKQSVPTVGTVDLGTYSPSACSKCRTCTFEGEGEGVLSKCELATVPYLSDY